MYVWQIDQICDFWRIAAAVSFQLNFGGPAGSSGGITWLVELVSSLRVISVHWKSQFWCNKDMYEIWKLICILRKIQPFDSSEVRRWDSIAKELSIRHTSVFQKIYIRIFCCAQIPSTSDDTWNFVSNMYIRQFVNKYEFWRIAAAVSF